MNRRVSFAEKKMNKIPLQNLSRKLKKMNTSSRFQKEGTRAQAGNGTVKPFSGGKGPGELAGQQ